MVVVVVVVAAVAALQQSFGVETVAADAPPSAPSAMVHSGTPEGVSEETDCAIRQFAWEYGRRLQPARGEFKSLFDALQLSACGVAPPAQQDSWAPPAASQPMPVLELVVDPVAGTDPVEDSVVTTKWHRSSPLPFRTITAAVRASRIRRSSQPVHVVLRGGVHFVEQTINLTAADSGLVIRNADGERAEVSGGVNLTLEWKPSTHCAGCFEADLSSQGIRRLYGLRRDGIREIRARFPNFDPEMDVTINGTRHFHDGVDGWIADPTQWIASGLGMNGVAPWPPVGDNATTFVVRDVDWPGVEWPMHVTTNGSVDPDGNTPSGVNVTGSGERGEFWLGVGGTCADRDPPVGYFCAPNNPRQISTPNHPSGMLIDKTLLPNSPYGNSSQAVVHAWRPGHWYTNIFEVGPSDGATLPNGSQQLMFQRGGFQGAEGVTDGEAWCKNALIYLTPNAYTVTPNAYCDSIRPWDMAACADIENVLEELDAEREWFFNESSKILLYKPNTTAEGTIDRVSGLPTGNFVGCAGVKVLFNISGTKAEPAHNITIQGLTIRDTTYTYLDVHGLPSAGDWGLQKQGAITLVGTQSVTIADCLLTRLDGNAVFLGGFNRNTSIVRNEFSFIGDSAMASWGDTSSLLNANGTLHVPGGYKVGPDGRSGEQPWATVVRANICHSIGLWEKQSSMWFQAVTALTQLQDNIFFTGPRAAFNFNDGFGGGDEISSNLLLNCVQESSDHGPWNSWSRVPYITEFHTPGKPSIIPATRTIKQNFVLANYNSFGAIDTDDGSAYMDVRSNFFAYGDYGLKSDFGGHNMQYRDNVLAYVGNCYHQQYKGEYVGYNDVFIGNQCVFRQSYSSDCGLARDHWHVHNNTVYSKSGSLKVCGMNFSAYQRLGHDLGSTIHSWPSDSALIAMGKAALGWLPEQRK